MGNLRCHLAWWSWTNSGWYVAKYIALYTREDLHGTWEYTAGKGKSSSKPSFSGSILIFGGVHPNASWGSVFRPPKDIWNTSHIGFELSPLNGCLVREYSLAALSSGFWYSNLFLWVLQEFYFENIVLYLTPSLNYIVCCFSRWFVAGQNWRLLSLYVPRTLNSFNDSYRHPVVFQLLLLTCFQRFSLYFQPPSNQSNPRYFY